MQEKKTIREFMEDYETALVQSGMRIGTRLHNVMRANKLARMHEKEGKEYLDGGVVAKFFDEISSWEYAGTHDRKYCENKRREAKRFLHYI